MADVYNPDQEEENQPGQVQQVPGGSMGAPEPGGSQPGAGQTMAGTGQGGQGQQRGSGRFTNIQKYLKANQGSQIGQDLGQKVQDEAKTPLSQMGTARDELQQNLKTEQDRLGSAGDLFGRINKQFGQQTPQQSQGQGGMMYAGGQAPGPNNVEGNRGGGSQQGLLQSQQTPSALTDQDYASFAQLRQGQAAAPEVGNLGELEAGTSKIGQLAQQAGTEQGRFGLLNQFYGRPTYNTGQQRLDQLLLQGNAGQAKALQSGAQQAGQQTAAQLAALKGMQTQGASDIASQAAARQQEAQGLIGSEAVGEGAGTGLLGGMVDTIEGRAASSQSDADELQKYLSQALGGGMDPGSSQKAMELAKKAGLNLDQQLYGVGTSEFRPERFLQQQKATAESVASDDERAKLSSLYKLAGKDQNFLTGPQTDKFNLGKVLNQGELDRVSGVTKQQYEAQYNPRAQELEALSNLQKAYTGSGGDYGQTMDALKKATPYLDPRLVNELMDTKELGQARAGGAHYERRYLNDVLMGNGWDNSNLDYFGGARNKALTDQTAALKRQYGAGNTLKDLLEKYKSIPMSGTQGTVQQAAGPNGSSTGGKIGLF